MLGSQDASAIQMNHGSEHNSDAGEIYNVNNIELSQFRSSPAR